MSSFSSKRVSSRMDHRDKSIRTFRFFAISVILFIFFMSYQVWNTWSVIIPAHKYTIEKWYTVSVLSDKLGFGVASWRYTLWLRFFGPKNISIKSGTYETTLPISISDFLTKTLTKPLYIDETVTILPGWSSYDIDAYLANKWIGKVGDFLDTSRINFTQYQADFPFLVGVTSLEWFLYPDTYRIRPEWTADDVIRVMLKEFSKKIGESYKTLDTKKAYEALILASIVEREERNDTNQPIVAGILSKRVKEWIAMWADATVCYGYAKTQKQCTPNFIATIIHDNNPYNTRTKQGYPPTPISNVPVSAWNAAIKPESSPYYYYLHGSDGQIHYGRTNEEHITNKQKYLD